MTRDHVDAGAAIFERIGLAGDRLSAAGYPELHGAIAGYARERRGRIQASPWAGSVARTLIDLADEVERVAHVLESQPGELIHGPRR